MRTKTEQQKSQTERKKERKWGVGRGKRPTQIKKSDRENG